MAAFIQNQNTNNEKDEVIRFLVEKIAKLVFHQQECDAKIAALVQRIEQLENKRQ